MTAQEARALIAQQCGRWPGLTAQDLVKALYQAALGCGHFAPDEARAAVMLREEAARLSAKAADAPLVEPIGPRFARVHLAPYLGTGASPDTLARAFALSAGADVSGGRAALEAGLGVLEAMAEADELVIPSRIEEKPVLEIADSAFAGKKLRERKDAKTAAMTAEDKQ